MLNIINYSPKSIALTGNYQGLEYELATIGGSYNSRLSCGPGWIFSKRNLPLVQQLVDKHNQSVDQSLANYIEDVLEHNYMRKSF